MYSINLRLLRIELRLLYEFCYWNNSPHWRSEIEAGKVGARVRVDIAYLAPIGWFAIILRTPSMEVSEIVKQLPTYERYFYREALNRHRQFVAWGISARCYESAIAQLQQLSQVQIAYVIRPHWDKFVLPEPLRALKLNFYECGRS
ncbi:MAG: hypothetical protein CLLPBCKN_006904 [Chroococcidiopsis cubana SAG 39.79]|uniref:Uncharacterized protein n=1 Tax=Chroococcidiopsis cubana SAG 39.79 TaxID=388085 RepID=A0AB37U975_9CYAN|nr:hypothetical protein [Chroococcidiopsis cubana]MDZ4877469.1 hypothetical protein [Chroococcidiopsis cubana SAG 39.79]PSB58915.1 hypothetical protein C7B79_29380 [Chroococcidiopsis cubana CCALA 043]RUT01184.1 hypothetical protein DSM107010_65950 [Chroococcidiopsis cubana SAG 39.79]